MLSDSTIGSFPLLNSPADAKDVNFPVFKASFYLAMDTDEESQNEEIPSDTEVSEEPQSEETSNEAEVSEESPDTENQNPDSEDDLEQTEVIEDSEASTDCPEGEIFNPRFGKCVFDFDRRLEQLEQQQDCRERNFGNPFPISKCQQDIFDRPESSNQTNSKPRKKPDLIIRKISFVRGRPKVLRVLVANVGNAPAKANNLQLFILRIRGRHIRSAMKVRTPRLGKNKSKWIVIKAQNLLPKKARIKNANFNLYVDINKVIRERNEKNNAYDYNP